MRTQNELTAEITKLTSMIQDKYPELYRNLDENPVTIPNAENPTVDEKEMSEYLEGMIQSLRKMIVNHEKALNARAESINVPSDISRTDSESEEFTV